MLGDLAFRRTAVQLSDL